MSGEAAQVEGARLYLQTKAASLTGVRAAPSRVPDSMTVWPFAITYVQRGIATRHTGALARTIWTFVTEFHVAKQDLGRNIETAQALLVGFMAKVWDFGDPPAIANQLGGYAVMVGDVRGFMAEMEYGGMPTYGVRVEIDAKVTGPGTGT